MLMRLMDFLKTRQITSVFTNLTDGNEKLRNEPISAFRR